jgi:imidazolonepropionase-like amidohydrolase
MTKIGSLVRVLGILLLFASMLAADDTERFVVLKAARMLDVQSGEIIEDVTVVIEGNTISAINPNEIPEKATMIDLGDKTLLPGLIDMHTHITSTLDEDWYDRQFRMTVADYTLTSIPACENTLNAGFTTVRNVGAPNFIDVSLMNAIDRGIIKGPRIVPCGHAIGATGGHNDAFGFYPGLLERDWRSGVADGPVEVVKAVRYQIKHGAQAIKIVTTAGILSFEASGSAQQMSDEEIKAAVEEARRHGVMICAHAHGPEGIMAAVQAGVDSIEHCSALTGEIIEEMKKRGTYMVPTVYVSKDIDASTLPPRLKEKLERLLPKVMTNLKKAISSGIKIAFGTDAGVYTHGLNAREFGMYVEAGMSELEAIRTATLYAIDLLGVDDRGVIEAGKLADLIAVEGNPLEDISVLENVSFVMKDGEIYKK